MPVTVSYPGVYIQEQSSGARAIPAVATSVAMFVGMAQRGRMDIPVRIFNFADFEREYGPETRGELAAQVLQFYLNGGGEAWVCRIANGEENARVRLEDEGGTNALTVTARDAGLEGNLIRAEVDYDTAEPGRTFNMALYRSRLQADGTRTREDEETYQGLSMDPASGNYVETAINDTSALVTVASEVAAGGSGISIAGLVLPNAQAGLAGVEGTLDALVTATANAIRISVDNNPPVTVTLSQLADITNPNVSANIAGQWEQDINDTLTGDGISASVTVEITGTGFASDSMPSRRLLRILSANGPVVVTPATSNDVSVALMLGAGAGGLEGDYYGDARPAPTGLVARIGTSANGYEGFRRFASEDRDDLTNFQLVDDSPDSPHSAPAPFALGGAVPMYDDGSTETLGNARDVFTVLAATIDANVSGRWTAARHGFRLVLTPDYGSANTGGSVAALTTSGGYDIGAANQPFAAAATPENVAAYTVGEPNGVPGTGSYQGGSLQGLDGTAPLPPDYADAYEVIERDASFNILVLPRADGQNDDARRALWGEASAFCAAQRAFLLIDPRSDWADVTAAEAGVDELRIGTETRNSAVFWPRLRIAGDTPNGQPIDPSGSIAGLMARTDGNRGVWKAAAGIEATIRGVIGVNRMMTDPENGVINPKALNAIRLFPAGVVSWGARTLVGFDGSGNIDDKYIPVRRTMLFIEESLYRGLKFAVFEPNDEPLWAQIRLAAGSFMNGLFRQGAFAGAKASDAYFVRCDSSTTTATDINLGIVNVIVGFAPLKPAEFVIVTVTQIAGQVEV